ncbi:hypothetical protein BDV06DRAFT_226796 [Aspergillus oleicola]
MAQGIGLHSTVGDERRSFAQKQIRRRAWHGCLMLDQAASTMLGRLATHSQSQSVPLPEAVDDCYLCPDMAICEQPPGILSRVEWVYCYVEVASAAAENEQEMTHSIEQAQILIQIDLDLESFRTSIPKPIDWESRADGQPDLLLREKCLLKARFLYLRLLAYRPVLSQSLNHMRDAQTKSDEDTRKIPETGIYSSIVMNCSVQCVQSAIELITLINETCSTELASVWFYNVFYTFSAGLSIIIAEHHRQVLRLVIRESLNLAWDKCHSTLDYLKSIDMLAERCAHTLNGTRARCSKVQSGFSSWVHNGPQTYTSSTIKAVAGEQGDENGSEDIFADIGFDNIDWSLFDFDY